MSTMKIGNQKFVTISVVDSDGNAITNLADADDILFMIKEDATDADSAAIVTKNKKTDADITINIPEVGDLQFYINSPETKDKTAGDKPWGCQINYTTDNEQEVDIKNKDTGEIETTVKFIQSVVRG